MEKWQEQTDKIIKGLPVIQKAIEVKKILEKIYWQGRRNADVPITSIGVEGEYELIKQLFAIPELKMLSDEEINKAIPFDNYNLKTMWDYVEMKKLRKLCQAQLNSIKNQLGQ